MKEKLIKYYGIIMALLFLLVNTIFKSLIISGILYYIAICLLLIFNVVILTEYKDKIKYKEFIIIYYFIFNLFIPKNGLQFLFGLMTIFTLIFTNLKKNSIKFILGGIVILVIVFWQITFLVLLIQFSSGLNSYIKDDFIYSDMHYKCQNNMEVYAYSAGASDSYHFSTRKKYKILNIDGIIHINYLNEEDITENEYHNYVNSKECKLIGDKYGPKKNIKFNKN